MTVVQSNETLAEMYCVSNNRLFEGKMIVWPKGWVRAVPRLRATLSCTTDTVAPVSIIVSTFFPLMIALIFNCGFLGEAMSPSESPPSKPPGSRFPAVFLDMDCRGV